MATSTKQRRVGILMDDDLARWFALTVGAPLDFFCVDEAPEAGLVQQYLDGVVVPSRTGESRDGMLKVIFLRLFIKKK